MLPDRFADEWSSLSKDDINVRHFFISRVIDNATISTAAGFVAVAVIFYCSLQLAQQLLHRKLVAKAVATACITAVTVLLF